MKLIKSAVLAIVLGVCSLGLASPSIEIFNPTDGSTVGVGLNPFWTLSQAPEFGVMSVEMYINGELVQEYDFQTMDFFDDVFVTDYWRTHGKGIYVLEAKVIDRSGDEAWAAPVTVTRP